MGASNYLLTVHHTQGSIRAVVIGEGAARTLAAILSSACGIVRITVHAYAGGILGKLIVEYGEGSE